MARKQRTVTIHFQSDQDFLRAIESIVRNGGSGMFSASLDIDGTWMIHIAVAKGESIERLFRMESTDKEPQP